MNNTVGFRNKNQVVLFECELKGQISDGMWENSRPYGHYEIPCNATSFVASSDTELGRNFPARQYNFSNAELVDIVGDRMINSVKMSQAFPHMPINKIPDIDSTASDTIQNWIRYAAAPVARGENPYVAKLADFRSLVGVDTNDQLIEKLEAALNSIIYTYKDLRRDLNDMKKCWKIVRHSI